MNHEPPIKAKHKKRVKFKQTDKVECKTKAGPRIFCTTFEHRLFMQNLHRDRVSGQLKILDGCAISAINFISCCC